VTGAPTIAWRWSWALLGAVCSLPAALVTLGNPSFGLALAFGALPAAAVGVRGRRRERHVILVVGACIALRLVLGALLSGFWLAAVGGIFVLSLGAAILSAHARVGTLLMVLAVPMVGAGLSFNGDISIAGRLAVLLIAGSIHGWLVCLLWPEEKVTARARAELPLRAVMAEYGVRLGLAGAVCAGLGFALTLEHKGWATAACLLVMRPTAEMTRLRGAGRAISVFAGALAACVLSIGDVAPVVIAVAVTLALAGLAGTRSSRWYVTAGFTTFIVILLLVYGRPEQEESRFLERVAETLLGVGIALIFGVLVPATTAWARRFSR
jgi:hypothetical protein